MNFEFYCLFFALCVIGAITGLKLKKKVLTVLSISAGIISFLLIAAALILVNGID